MNGEYPCDECSVEKPISTSTVTTSSTDDTVYDEGSGIPDSVGTIRWKVNGYYHRIDGPAVIFSDGDKYWYINGQNHRLDGPAVERANGSRDWYLYGEYFWKVQDWEKRVQELKLAVGYKI